MMDLKKYIFIFSFVFSQFTCASQVYAEEKRMFDTFKDNVVETWQQPQHYDLYIPAIT